MAIVGGDPARVFAALLPFNHLVSMVGDVSGGGILQVPMAEIRRVLEARVFTNVHIGPLAPQARVNAVCPTWTVTPLLRHVPAEQVEAMRTHDARSIPLGERPRSTKSPRPICS